MKHILAFIIHGLIELLVAPFTWVLGACLVKILSLGQAKVGRFRYCTVDMTTERQRDLYEKSDIPRERLLEAIRIANRTMWAGTAVMISPIILVILLFMGVFG